MKIIIILLIISILIYYKLNSQNIETFYTFFKPYYTKKPNYNYDLYAKKLYNNISFEKTYKYNPIKIATTKKENDFLNLITKIIIKNSKILYIDYIRYKNYHKMLQDLNDNKLQLISVSYSIFDDIDDKPNIRYVCTTDIKYIYICKRSDNSKMQDFSYIKDKTVIGILDKDESYIFIKMLMDFIGLAQNTDYKLKIYHNKEKLLNDLNDNKIEIALFNDVYPTDVFTKYYNIKLMELKGFRKTIFFEQYKQYFSKQSIDLNNMGSHYLPKSYGTTVYSQFNPYFDVISFETFLLTNIYVSDNYIIDILKSINDNIYLLNRLPQYMKVNIKYNTSIMNKILYGILPSNGTLKYLNDHGYISDIDNNNCKYFIGKNKCTMENLALLT